MTELDPADAYILKAYRALQGAGTLLAEGDTEGACNRAYYAMFDAAHAALWATGAQEPGAVIKSHSGLISVFAHDLVKAGKVPAEYGRALGRVQKTRLIADYTADLPPEAVAQESIALAQAFVEAMRKICQES